MIPKQSLGKILIVDDDPATLQMLDLTLKRTGYAVLVASSGMRALEIIRDENPEAVLLDVMMPERSGLEVLQTLRRTHPYPPPVILFTAKAGIDDMIAGREAGAFRYLVKPVSKEELLTAVKDAVHHFRTRPPLKPGRI